MIYKVLLLFFIQILFTSCSEYNYNYYSYSEEKPSIQFPGAGAESLSRDLNVTITEAKPLKEGSNNIVNNSHNNQLVTVTYALPINKYNFKYNLFDIVNIKDNNKTTNKTFNSKNEFVEYVIQNSPEDIFYFETMKSLRDKEKEVIKILKKLYDENNFPQYFKKTYNKSSQQIGDKIYNLNVPLSVKGDNKPVLVTLKHITKNTNIYVEDNVYESNTLVEIDLDIIKKVGEVFEEIFPKVTTIYGNLLDIDGNGKINVIITKTPNNILGFVSSGDVLPKSSHIHSNYGEYFYLNYDSINKLKPNNIDDKKNNQIYATIPHELKHLIFFENRILKNKIFSSLEDWIYEGLARTAEYYTGYTYFHNNAVEKLLRMQYSYSLTNLEDVQSYTYGYLFFRYIIDRLGDEYFKNTFIPTLLNTSHTNIKAVEDASGLEFNQLYTDFMQNLILSGRGISNNKEVVQDKMSNITTGINLKDEVNKYLNTSVPNISANSSANIKLYPYSFVINKFNNTTNLDFTNNSENIKSFYTFINTK